MKQSRHFRTFCSWQIIGVFVACAVVLLAGVVLAIGFATSNSSKGAELDDSDPLAISVDDDEALTCPNPNARTSGILMVGMPVASIGFSVPGLDTTCKNTSSLYNAVSDALELESRGTNVTLVIRIRNASPSSP